MTAILQEYGLLIISAMAVGGFFVIFTVFMGSEEADVSARRIYKGNQLWANQGYTEGGGETSFEVLFNDEADMNDFYGMTDVITNASKTSIPFFIVSDSKDYIFRPVSTGTKVYNGINIPTHADTIKVTRDRLLEGVDCYYYNSSGQKVALNKNDITVLVTYYEYQIAYNEDTLAPTGVPQVEEVQAVDMFGNPIFNADGSPQIVTRYLYSVNPGTDDLRLESDFEGYGTNCDTQFTPGASGIEISADTAYKIKVIYRIEHGTMKAEYTALFSNKIRPQYQRADWMFDQVFDNTNEERDPVTGQNVLSLEGYSLRPESIESDYVVVPEYEPTVTQVYTNGEDASNPDNNPNKSEKKPTETPKEEPKADNEEKTNVDNSNDNSDFSNETTDTTNTSSSSSSTTDTSSDSSSSADTGSDSGTDTSNTSSSEPSGSEPSSEQSRGTSDEG